MLTNQLNTSRTSAVYTRKSTSSQKLSGHTNRNLSTALKPMESIAVRRRSGRGG